MRGPLLPAFSAVAWGCPSRVVCRRILTDPMLPPGAKVVVAGQRPLGLAELLSSLAYDVTILCEDPQAVLLARQQLPESEVLHWSHPERLPLQARQTDLIVADDAGLFAGNLLELGPRLATAQLLSTLKPRGRFVFVRRLAVKEAHEIVCWSRHLSCFPGEVEVRRVPDPWFSAGTWDWLRGRRARGETHLITLRTPAEAVRLEEWRDFARRGLLTNQRSCCQSAALVMAAQRRRAA